MYAYSYADGICANYPIKLPFCQALFPDSLLEELIDALARSEDRELRHRMEVLLVHVLKWKTQPPGTKSWRLTINEQRRQIAELRQDNPRFTEAYIRERWPRYLLVALAKAQDEMDQPAVVDTPSWAEVFEE